MGRKVDADLLVDAQQIADRLGLSHAQNVHSWRRRYPDFPEPVCRLSRVLVWYWPDVDRWAQRRRRT